MWRLFLPSLLLGWLSSVGCLPGPYPDAWDPDGDGYGGADDCDPDDPDIHVGADEDCTDGIDNNCDGDIDGNDAQCQDADGDGYTQLIDCDDDDPDVYPGAEEICDAKDSDCDGETPEDETDEDGDGYAECNGECDDSDAAVHPGAAELCNGVDDDCDGVLPADEQDEDGDGHGTCDGDCDDADDAVIPGVAVEIDDISWVCVPAGSFEMGSPVGEIGRDVDEVPHAVTLTRPFFVMTTELTQGEFEALAGVDLADCSGGCGADHPVQSVSWFDAVVAANELSTDAGLSPCYRLDGVVCEDGTAAGSDPSICMTEDKGGIEAAVASLGVAGAPYECEGYRLPTEAEWEYAARSAGQVTDAFPTGGNLLSPLDEEDCGGDLVLHDGTALDDVAWYCGNGADQCHAVRSLDPSPYGLYDVSGNVWEWCHDWYTQYGGDATDPWGPASGDRRVNRGGYASSIPGLVRMASRNRFDPGGRSVAMGFRLVRTADP